MTYKTITGRYTSAIPKPGKSRSYWINRKIPQWLKENAISEAKARGDEWMRIQFEWLDIKLLTQADKDAIHVYLYGDPCW